MASGIGVAAAIGDIREGATLAPLWWRVGIENTAARYRRTLLGPFWLAGSTLSTGLALVAVFGGILGGDWRTTIPFVLTGVMVWSLVSGVIVEGSQTFLGASGLMQTRRMPLSYHVYLQLHRTVINFLHQLIAYWGMMLALGFFTLPHWHLLFSLPLVLAFGFFMAFPLGMLSTRYRDVSHFIGLAMGALFMLTPVFWKRANISSGNEWIVDWNPFTYLLETVRQPFLGHAVEPRYWVVLLFMLVVSMGLAVLSSSIWSRRVVFWL